MDGYMLASKLGWMILRPSSVLSLLLACSTGMLWTRRAAWGQRIATATVIVLMLVAILPVARWLILPLEDRFPQPRAIPARIDGIIVLGGAVDPIMTADRGLPSLTGQAERMTAFVALARAHPEAKLLFTGGSGALVPGSLREADVAAQVFAQLGLDPGRVVFERESRNTWENVTLSKPLVAPRRDEVWLMVTSAMHVPRAIGVFRQAGWPVVPWPVAYRTGHDEAVGFGFDLGQLFDVEVALREWIGLAVYWSMGRTDALFPGP